MPQPIIIKKPAGEYSCWSFCEKCGNVQANNKRSPDFDDATKCCYFNERIVPFIVDEIKITLRH